LVAFAGLLMACFRQSQRRTALFLETLWHQPCCPPSPSSCKRRAPPPCGRPSSLRGLIQSPCHRNWRTIAGSGKALSS
jgi:hypothetical protein